MLTSLNRPILFSLITACMLLLTAGIGSEFSFRWYLLEITILFVLSFSIPLISIKLLSPKMRRDDISPAILIVLVAFGVASLIRLDPLLAYKQLAWITMGNIAFAAIIHLPVWAYIHRLHRIWAPAALVLLVTTLIFGVEAGGSRAWLNIGVQFQPVEFVKLMLIFALSFYFSAWREAGSGKKRIAYVAKSFLFVTLVAALLVAQRDVGTSLLLFALSAMLSYVATGGWTYLLVGTIVGLGTIGWAAVYFTHVQLRLLAWVNPWAMPEGAGYQIVQAAFALGAGGLFGTGWGKGLAHNIPAVETDLILALITEELGFFGAACLLILLALLCIRMMNPAFDTEQQSAVRLTSAGIALLFALQTGLIVGGVTRLLPLTGVTLPFVSYGGSSMIASFVQLAIIYNLNTRSPRGTTSSNG